MCTIIIIIMIMQSYLEKEIYVLLYLYTVIHIHSVNDMVKKCLINFY